MMTRRQDMVIFFITLRFGLLFILLWLKVGTAFSAPGDGSTTSQWRSKWTLITYVIQTEYLLPIQGTEHREALKKLLIISQYLAFDHKCGFDIEEDEKKCNKVFQWLVLAYIAKDNEKGDCKKITYKDCTGVINQVDDYLQMKVSLNDMHKSLASSWGFYKGEAKSITIREMGKNFGHRVNAFAEKIEKGLIKRTPSGSGIQGTEKDESDVDEVYRGFFEMIHSILPTFKALKKDPIQNNQAPWLPKKQAEKKDPIQNNQASVLQNNQDDTLSNSDPNGGGGSKVNTGFLETDSNHNGDNDKDDPKYNSINGNQGSAGEVNQPKVLKEVPWYKTKKVLLVPGGGLLIGGIIFRDKIWDSIFNNASETALTPKPTIQPKLRPPRLSSKKIWHYFWLYFGFANLLGTLLLCCYVFRKGKGKPRFKGWKALCRSACYGFWNGIKWLMGNLFACLRVVKVDKVWQHCCCCCPCYLCCTRAMRRPLPKARRSKRKKTAKYPVDSSCASARQSRRVSTSYSCQKPSTFPSTFQTSDQYSELSGKPSNNTFSTNAFSSKTSPSMSSTSPSSPLQPQLQFSPQANVHQLSPPSPNKAGSPIASAPRVSFASPPPNLQPNLNAMRPLAPPSPNNAGSPIASAPRVSFASPPPNLQLNLNGMRPPAPPNPSQIANPPWRQQTHLALQRPPPFQVGSPTGKVYSPSAPPFSPMGQTPPPSPRNWQH